MKKFLRVFAPPVGDETFLELVCRGLMSAAAVGGRGLSPGLGRLRH